MARFNNLPNDLEIAGKVVDATSALELKKCEMGLVGQLLGDTHHKPGSIAFLTIAVSFVLLGLTLLMMEDSNPNQGTAVTLFGGLISASVGYLFGKSAEKPT